MLFCIYNVILCSYIADMSGTYHQPVPAAQPLGRSYSAAPRVQPPRLQKLTPQNSHGKIQETGGIAIA